MSDIAGSFAVNAKTQRLFVWSGIAAVPLMFGGLLLARVLPPHNATWSAERIVEIYTRHPTLVQLGCVLMMVGFAFWGWWTASISLWVWRTESRRFPILTFATLVLTAINTMVVELMSISFAVTGFRAGHISPEITLTLNDVSWFLYYYTWPPYVLWLIAIAIAMLRDKNQPAIFPRWLGWLTLAECVTIFPNAIQTFHFAENGPFAWDGFVTCWLVAGFHGPWTFLVAYYILKAVKREEKVPNPSSSAKQVPVEVYVQ
ncbi:MAG: hypothetical protein J2P18_03690 [Nocardia sp.]|nr:hypothetical protein [Nocardia sp.]